MPDIKAKILLVEDDVGLASVYKARLEAEGFQVFHCDNGESALSDAIKFRPDLIILDVMMPKISGFDVLDILHNTPETMNIKVVMLTALSQPKDVEKAKQLGADDYLVKSQVVIADVIDRIKHHLNIGGGAMPQAPTEATQAS
jgi:DNA-binding response OmpR family regulator